jgi:hypothetical protein
MIIKNKLDKTFGPFGSSTGLFIFILGLLATYFSAWCLIIAAAGAFASFTTTSALIDTDKKRVRLSDNLFGIIRVGKWIAVLPCMRLKMTKNHRGFQGYIRANQPIGIHYHDFRIVLVDCENKPVMHLKKGNSPDLLKNDLANLSSLLGLEII